MAACATHCAVQAALHQDDLQTLCSVNVYDNNLEEAVPYIALNGPSAFWGRKLQDSLCGYEFLNGVSLLPSGFLHRLPLRGVWGAALLCFAEHGPDAGIHPTKLFLSIVGVLHLHQADQSAGLS